MAFSAPDPLDDLFRKLQRGELSRRAFMRRAAALGIAAPAATFMARAAGVAAQDATPDAGASPVAGGGASLGLRDLLQARERQLSEERNRERWLRVRLFRGGGSTSSIPEAAD